MDQDRAEITEVQAPELPERLKRALGDRKMTRKQLASATKISKNTLTAWNRERPRAQIETLAKAANKLGVEVADLIGPVAGLSAATPVAASAPRLEEELAAVASLLAELAESAPDLMGSLARTEEEVAHVRASFASLLEVAERLRALRSTNDE